MGVACYAAEEKFASSLVPAGIRRTTREKKYVAQTAQSNLSEHFLQFLYQMNS
jgi:hypothetical protein